MKHLIKYRVFESYNKFGTKSLTEREFDQIRKENCKNWTKAQTPLYRGMPDLGDYLYIDPLKGEFRKSIEDINIHIDLISNLPSWKDYPKYERCVIGMTNQKTIQYGSEVYEVIPFDDVKIAICPEENIWESFSDDGWGEDIYLVSDFLDSIDVTCDWVGISGLSNLDKIVEISNKEKWDKFLRKCALVTGKKVNEITGEDCYNFINEHLFNPVKRGFKLNKYNKDFKVDGIKQFWTEGPCLLIKSNLV